MQLALENNCTVKPGRRQRRAVAPLGFRTWYWWNRERFNDAIFRSCFFRCLPLPGNFSADALAIKLRQKVEKISYLCQAKIPVISKLNSLQKVSKIFILFDLMLWTFCTSLAKSLFMSETKAKLEVKSISCLKNNHHQLSQDVMNFVFTWGDSLRLLWVIIKFEW